MRRFLSSLILGIAVMALIFNINRILTVLGLPELPADVLAIARALAAMGVVVIIGNSLAEDIRIGLGKKLGKKVYGISSLVKFSGYVVALVAGIAASGLSPESALAGGVFGGLVVGLALQPVLGNFFAGLIIMLFRYVEVGDQVRILSTQIPYAVTILPAYKFFSVENADAGYKGTVVDVELLYTRLITDSGREIRIPNLVLLSSSVMDYTSKYSGQEVVSVRVELPISPLDPSDLLDRVRASLEGFDLVGGPYISEQSDKDYVILVARIRVPEGRDWREVKSEALEALMRLRRGLMQIQSQAQQAQAAPR